MAATLASVCSVPLTSVLLLFELTKDYRILLPLMVNIQTCLSYWPRILSIPESSLAPSVTFKAATWHIYLSTIFFNLLRKYILILYIHIYMCVCLYVYICINLIYSPFSHIFQSKSIYLCVCAHLGVSISYYPSN